jgi:hypothetical protein
MRITKKLTIHVLTKKKKKKIPSWPCNIYHFIKVKMQMKKSNFFSCARREGEWWFGGISPLILYFGFGWLWQALRFAALTWGRRT